MLGLWPSTELLARGQTNSPITLTSAKLSARLRVGQRAPRSIMIETISTILKRLLCTQVVNKRCFSHVHTKAVALEGEFAAGAQVVCIVFTVRWPLLLAVGKPTTLAFELFDVRGVQTGESFQHIAQQVVTLRTTRVCLTLDGEAIQGLQSLRLVVTQRK